MSDWLSSSLEFGEVTFNGEALGDSFEEFEFSEEIIFEGSWLDR